MEVEVTQSQTSGVEAAGFYEQWNPAPTFEEFIELIKLYELPGHSLPPDPELAYKLAKLYSYLMMDEQVPVELLDELQLGELQLKLLQVLNLPGNPIERGLLAAAVLKIYSERYMQSMTSAHGEGMVKEMIQHKAEEIGKETGIGRGGESHNGLWFGGIEQPAYTRYMSSDAEKKIMQAIKALKKFSAFQLGKRESTAQTRKALFGELTRLSYAELPEDPSTILLETLLLPELFELSMLERRVPYWEQLEKTPKKRIWFIMNDDSGSMNQEEKQVWVLALFFLIAQDVLKGGSEAFIAPYEWRLGSFFHIHNKASLNNFMRQYRGGHGGDTNIEGCMESFGEQLREKQIVCTTGLVPIDTDKMELFIICDGQDEVDSYYTPTIRAHSISLFNKNRDIDNAIKRSGGTPFWIERNGELKISDGKTTESEYEW